MGEAERCHNKPVGIPASSSYDFEAEQKQHVGMAPVTLQLVERTY